MSKSQRIIASTETIQKLTKLMDNCKKAKDNLLWVEKNKELLPVQTVQDSIMVIAKECGNLYDFLADLELCSLNSCGQIQEQEKPTATISLPKYTDYPARYKHECNDCTYLGQFDCYDLYFCPQGQIPTVIARFGDEKPDYNNGLNSRLPSLQEAERRAREMGLLK